MEAAMSRTLLYLARDLPVPISGAARLRTYNWLLHLSRHFEVTFVAPVRVPADEAYLDVLRPYCAALHAPVVMPRAPWARLVARITAELRAFMTGVPPEATHLGRGEPRALLERLARQQRFDAVFVEKWTWGEAAPALGRSAVLDSGAPQSPRLSAMFGRSRNPLRRSMRGFLASRAARHEAAVLGHYGLVLTHSPVEERQVLELCAAARTVALPAGLDVGYFEPCRNDVDPANIVFYGALDGPAQRDALVHLYQDILPAVRARLRHAAVTVVDAEPIAELATAARVDRHLAFTGAVDDVRVPLRRGAVAAMPLRFGSGSRSRLAQLLALGIPVVVTPNVARGLGVRSGDGIVVAAAGAEFARVLGDVLTDATLRDDLSRRGRMTAEAQFSIAATYELLSAQLAAAPSGD
jgi:glycosyltransferase involved in cell wall biosynthesis